jgi:hypothetical protein
LGWCFTAAWLDDMIRPTRGTAATEKKIVLNTQLKSALTRPLIVPPTRKPNRKSFLVLFRKKQPLALVLPPHA